MDWLRCLIENLPSTRSCVDHWEMCTGAKRRAAKIVSKIQIDTTKIKLLPETITSPRKTTCSLLHLRCSVRAGLSSISLKVLATNTACLST